MTEERGMLELVDVVIAIMIVYVVLNGLGPLQSIRDLNEKRAYNREILLEAQAVSMYEDNVNIHPQEVISLIYALKDKYNILVYSYAPSSPPPYNYNPDTYLNEGLVPNPNQVVLEYRTIDYQRRVLNADPTFVYLGKDIKGTTPTEINDLNALSPDSIEAISNKVNKNYWYHTRVVRDRGEIVAIRCFRTAEKVPLGKVAPGGAIPPAGTPMNEFELFQ